eukprot:6518293-Prymnesium_polylepis.1
MRAVARAGSWLLVAAAAVAAIRAPGWKAVAAWAVCWLTVTCRQEVAALEVAVRTRLPSSAEPGVPTGCLANEFMASAL